MTLLWVFTEHYNATFEINFAGPVRMAADLGLRLRAWDASTCERLGLPLLIAELEAALGAERPGGVVFSRFASPVSLELIRFLRGRGLRCHFHLDDLLFAVPLELGERYTSAYGPAFVSVLDDCLGAVNSIWCSTHRLAQHVTSRNPGLIVHVLNGVCYMPQPTSGLAGVRARIARASRQMKRGKLRMGYMGSASHRRDLATVTDELARLLHTMPNLEFETFGVAVPEELTRAFPGRVRRYGANGNYQAFLTSLFELRWDVGIAPLVDDVFNHSKTCTKFLEYTACGVATFAHALPPYIDLPPETVLASDSDRWHDAAQALLLEGAERKRRLHASQQHCTREYGAHAGVRRILKLLVD